MSHRRSDGAFDFTIEFWPNQQERSSRIGARDGAPDRMSFAAFDEVDALRLFFREVPEGVVRTVWRRELSWMDDDYQETVRLGREAVGRHVIRSARWCTTYVVPAPGDTAEQVMGFCRRVGAVLADGRFLVRPPIEGAAEEAWTAEGLLLGWTAAGRPRQVCRRCGHTSGGCRRCGRVDEMLGAFAGGPLCHLPDVVRRSCYEEETVFGGAGPGS